MLRPVIERFFHGGTLNIYSLNTMQAEQVKFSTIEEAVEAFKKGQFVIVMDDEDRENEGDLILAAELVTAEKVALALRHTSGILCAPMTYSRANELRLPIMVTENTDPNKTAFTISCDANETSTGVSAQDRYLTFAALADSSRGSADFRRPGHVFPLIAKPDGVLQRRGHTEAAVDLCKLADLTPVGFIGEMMKQDGTMMRRDDCFAFAKEHNFPIITIDALVEYRKSQADQTKELSKSQKIVELISHCDLPIERNNKKLGTWHLYCYFSHRDGRHHVALVKGRGIEEAKSEVPLVRVHSECFTGDVLGSLTCDCGEQLTLALEKIDEAQSGILIYHMGHEGRGIGLGNKIRAYNLQQTKQVDTFEANKILGFPADLRTYETAEAILEDLGVNKIKLLTNNQEKVNSLKKYVQEVVPLQTEPNTHNAKYLKAKHDHQAQLKETIQIVVKDLIENKNILGSAGVASANSEIGSTTSEKSPQASEHHKSVPLYSSVPLPREAAHLRVGLVKTMWNETLVRDLTTQIKDELKKLSVKDENIIELTVPGSFELPYAAKQLAHPDEKLDAVICCGVLIKGETFHFEMISTSVANGLMNIQIETGVPMINGVLNCMTIDQAEARCGYNSDLPSSLACTAVYMANLKSTKFTRDSSRSDLKLFSSAQYVNNEAHTILTVPQPCGK
jgi:3,4-dihydroxy 2-butanone 4-phosphate synthase/GTP cyclohydrolase II